MQQSKQDLRDIRHKKRFDKLERKTEFDSWLYSMEKQIRESYKSGDLVRYEWQLAFAEGFKKCMEIVESMDREKFKNEYLPDISGLPKCEECGHFFGDNTQSRCDCGKYKW